MAFLTSAIAWFCLAFCQELFSSIYNKGQHKTQMSQEQVTQMIWQRPAEILQEHSFY